MNLTNLNPIPNRNLLGMEKREKGLCFQCEDKWYLGHICKKKEPSLLISQGDDTLDFGDFTKTWSTVCLNLVIEFDNLKTVKFLGSIDGQ